MSIPSTVAASVTCVPPSGPGWVAEPTADGGTLHWKGSLQAKRSVKETIARDGAVALAPCLAAATGHFAMIHQRPDRLIAATDIVATTPLFTADGPRGLAAGGNADAVSKAAGLGDGFDYEAALQIAMAGYTFGRRTLRSGLESLKPGEIATLDANGLRRTRYQAYLCRPDTGIDASDPDCRRKVTDLFATILERMVAELDGRTIAVPLSAGLDSRAIVSGLKEIGCTRVVTFSYGLPGNHEAEGARRIAEALGYAWVMVPYTSSGMQRFFQGETVAAFRRFADRPDAMPFIQDLPAMQRLVAANQLPEDAVIVNGQSGDYIAGGHIPSGLTAEALEDLPAGEIADRIFEAVVDKHASLWRYLLTPANLERLRVAFEFDVDETMESPPTADTAYAMYELSEYDNRQSKYVVDGQRAYEFFGREWRLPLWDPEFVAFWARVPAPAKLGEALYRQALEAANWGGVWGPEWEKKLRVVPRWLAPLRTTAKLLCAPFGRQRWHAVERRLFNWLMDPVQNYAIVPFGGVLTDRRGHRNALSWHAEAYLRFHGIPLPGLTA